MQIGFGVSSWGMDAGELSSTDRQGEGELSRLRRASSPIECAPKSSAAPLRPERSKRLRVRAASGPICTRYYRVYVMLTQAFEFNYCFINLHPT